MCKNKIVRIKKSWNSFLTGWRKSWRDTPFSATFTSLFIKLEANLTSFPSVFRTKSIILRKNARGKYKNSKQSP